MTIARKLVKGDPEMPNANALGILEIISDGDAFELRLYDDGRIGVYDEKLHHSYQEAVGFFKSWDSYPGWPDRSATDKQLSDFFERVRTTFRDAV